MTLKLPFVSVPVLRTLGKFLNSRAGRAALTYSSPDDRDTLMGLGADINQLEYELSGADRDHADDAE